MCDSKRVGAGETGSRSVATECHFTEGIASLRMTSPTHVGA